jgi:hypothetical protein
VESNKLYTPDGVWIYVNERVAPYIPIHDLSAKTYFPDILKLPHGRLELLQLGWRASDEGSKKSRPVMSTTQPWQVFAWTASRYGGFRILITSVSLTREGMSVLIRAIARGWKQRWSKDEAIDLVATHLRRGEWAPLLTAWLGDGKAERGILCSKYRLIISAKEPWRLGLGVGTNKALVATGREAFVKLREAAGVYGELLDLLKAHKWFYIKLATDDDFRAAYKLKAKKRSIDVLREIYKHNNNKISTEQYKEAMENDLSLAGDLMNIAQPWHTEGQKKGAVVIRDIVMYLALKNGKGGSLIARRFVRDVKKALAIAERLESAELKPNIVRAGSFYMVYIATADLLKLAKKDDTIRRAMALYLAEKAKNGTPRQREIAEKILKRNPLFSQYLFTVSLKPVSLCVNQY